VPTNDPGPDPGPATDDIGRSACLALLGAEGIGRVAVSIGAVPAVFPVHYAMLDGEIVFRTAGGTSLDAALRNAVVAFEVDDVDPLHHGGWSVLVVGTADEITDVDTRTRAEELAWRPRRTSADVHVMAIRPELISGRRVAVSPV
jgi:nitroimidazol reductase NimA-like FMN-containing flavoprotein (pyridoxamine 5'-phosphate oxidase superfamily)